MITIMVDLFSLILFADFQYWWSRGQGICILKRSKLESNFVTNNRYVTCQYDAKQSSEGVSLPISRTLYVLELQAMKNIEVYKHVLKIDGAIICTATFPTYMTIWMKLVYGNNGNICLKKK